MYLKSIKIENFRNLKTFTSTFHPGLNVIVGENNIGKTNLLDAIRLALGYQSTNEPIKITREDFHIGVEGKRTNDPIKIDLEFAGLNTDEQADFLEILNFESSNPDKSTASIHFQCSWNVQKNRPDIKKWGGRREKSDYSIPEDVLTGIQGTYLAALRDAVSSLSPGRNSRLGKLLVSQANDEEKKIIYDIFQKANDDLGKEKLIIGTEKKLNNALESATGANMKQNTLIRSSEPEFDKIVRNLKLVLKSENNVIQELAQNGLGYNNLLYIATVLAELEETQEATLPLFLVEEPEAHLHPQLQVVLTKFLETGVSSEKKRKVQTFITTHSPTLASCVPLSSLVVIHKISGVVKSFPLSAAGLQPMEERKVKRMMDVTRSSLLFSKGVIFVEGVSEGMLIPVIADRLGKNLEDRHISVIPICGVDFSSICKLFGKDKLEIKVSVITDGDPEIISGTKEEGWRGDLPKDFTKSPIPPGPRAVAIDNELKGNVFVSSFLSEVTLEFDLASAGNNAEEMKKAWDSLFKKGAQQVIDDEELRKAKNAREKALLIWRGICRSSTTKSKADFAQVLSDNLAEKIENTFRIKEFTSPEYIAKAIAHVTAP